MSDSRVRDLERRWRLTGAVADETAWLRERLRNGELKEEQLELAAYLGYGAASAIIGVETPRTTRALLTGMTRWSSEEMWRRVAVGLIRQTDWDQVERSRRTVRLLEADVECRCSRHWSELTALPNPPYPEGDRHRAAARAARYAVLAALHPEDALECLQEVAMSLTASSTDISRGLQTDLVPWVLGYFDPVRERVNARALEATSD
jgi:hypothetical protein